jgi:hypothetical protein
VKPERLDERLRRLEQQVRAFKELHVAELQLILDEVADIKRELAEDAAPVAAATSDDPAARSPKRAKWLAEQERKTAPRTRRELLGGTGEER